LNLSILLQPRASRNEIAGFRDGVLRVRLTSPPVENRANRHLIEFLAETFGVPKTAVRIVSGSRSRRKTVAVEGLTREQALAILAHYLVE
jgi:uncharacterized protein (TIGR00251 family)